MRDIIYEFLDYLSLEKKYSDHTEVNYEIDLDKYVAFLDASKKHYLKVKYADISEYIIYLKKSNYKANSINRNLSTIRSFYNFLISVKKTDNNPFSLVSSVKTEKKLPNYFKYEEFIQMLETLDDNTNLNTRNLLILELLLATGLRVSELVNIKMQDINIQEREIKVFGKGKKERIVFYGKLAEEKLQKYLEFARQELLKEKNNEYLLINHLGNKLTDRGVRLIIENILKKAQITSKVSPHTFRHTFATMLLNNGCNIKSVQELLGHASINTTSIYTHLTNEEIRRVYLGAHPRAKK